MKNFETYQYLEGEPMTERDKREVGSKFWNEGKWTNFVAPFLPENCTDMTLVDMGCNAGLFLKLAEEKGFSRVIGVDGNKEAVLKGLVYRDRIGGNYEIRNQSIEECIDQLPLSDYTVLANVHYYFKLDDWITYIEKLKNKTAYCIIVTAEKKPVTGAVASDVEGIRAYFKDWQEVGFADVPLLGDPSPRRLWGLCFKSALERVPIDMLDNGNGQQRGFLDELDQDKDVLDTQYYKRLQSYRKRTTSGQTVWTDEQLADYMNERRALYDNIKTYGLTKAIEADKDNRIIDGNHRHEIMKHLGHKSILIKKR